MFSVTTCRATHLPFGNLYPGDSHLKWELNHRLFPLAGAAFTSHADVVTINDFGEGRYGPDLGISGDKRSDTTIDVLSDHALTAAHLVL